MSSPRARRAKRALPRPIARLAWQRAYTSAALMLALFIVYVFLNHGFGWIEALGISNSALPLALAAAGETFVMLTNGIDLSIGSVISLSNVVCAALGADHGALGIIAALAIGAAAGLVNGLVVSYMRIAPLIATLATSSIYMGIALIVLSAPGGAVPPWLPNWTVGSIGTIPVAAIWLLVSVLLAWIVLRRTRFGINLQALGGSESAARSAGIKVTRTRIGVYVASGFCCGLAGVILAGLTQSGEPTIGTVYLLNAIAAVVVGGTSLSGGVGTIAGSIFGAIVLTLVSSVLLVSGISTNYQYIVTGLIVIGALLAHSLHGRLGLRAARRAQQAQTGVAAS